MRCSAPTACGRRHRARARVARAALERLLARAPHPRGCGASDTPTARRARRAWGRRCSADPALHGRAARGAPLRRRRAGVHALSHVTGGGIAANLARVLPDGVGSSSSAHVGPPPVFRVLADLGGLALADAEGTWNLGIGMLRGGRAGVGDRLRAAPRLAWVCRPGRWNGRAGTTIAAHPSRTAGCAERRVSTAEPFGSAGPTRPDGARGPTRAK